MYASKHLDTAGAMIYLSFHYSRAESSIKLMSSPTNTESDVCPHNKGEFTFWIIHLRADGKDG